MSEPVEQIDFRLANAEDRHREAPQSFRIPPRTERESLAVGGLAKLIFELLDPRNDDPGGERMWVRILRVEGGRYVGALDNEPRAVRSLHLGDTLHFGPEHIIAVSEDWPLLYKRILVSRRSFDGERPRFIYRETPDNDRDSGWRAMVGDETEDEVGQSANFIWLQLGAVLDQWSELRSVFKSDPRDGDWKWDESAGVYRSA